MDGHEQYLRYRPDRTALAAIGTRLESQVSRISVRLLDRRLHLTGLERKGAVAESATAAWASAATASRTTVRGSDR